jgi:hypothetical protein
VARQVGFAREADMLAPLLAAATRRGNVGHGLDAHFEVQTPSGVADALFAVIDLDIAMHRAALGLPPLLDEASVAVVAALSDMGSIDGIGDGVHPNVLEAHVAVGPKHLRCRLVPQLLESGWVTRDGSGLHARTEFRPPVGRIVAVELKRSDWRGAISQAATHTAFADETWVGMDSARCSKVANMSAPFMFAGVGLLSISPERDGRVERLLPASRRRPRGLARAVVAERLLALQASSPRTGAVGHVFGRMLTTTSGPDPRFGSIS